MFLLNHSVEKSSKMRSRILRKNEHFFRQINTKMNHLPIYYIKPLWENANSNFSRKFAPGFSTGSYKGGLNLKNSVEKPADTQRYQKLCQCKVGLFLARIISTHSWYFKKHLLCEIIIGSYPTKSI